MYRRLERPFTFAMLILTVFTVTVFYGMKSLHSMSVAWNETGSFHVDEKESMLDMMQGEGLEDNTIEGLVGQIRLEMPEGITRDNVKVMNNYIDRTITINIEGVTNTYFYDYPLSGSSDHVENMYFENEGGVGVIDIIMDSVYEPRQVFEGNYMYLNLIDPRAIYDYIVVVDAGHGGSDGGAEVRGVAEKDLDLQIVEKLGDDLEECDKYNIGVYYTRTEDRFVSLDSRVSLANTLGCDLFISIHNNTSANGRMSYINGTSVLYKMSDETGRSQAFAQCCLNHMLDSLGSLSKGLVAGDNIYIVRMSKSPVALCEVGFMTNEEEFNNLKSVAYQKKAADALYGAIIETLEENNE